MLEVDNHISCIAIIILMLLNELAIADIVRFGNVVLPSDGFGNHVRVGNDQDNVGFLEINGGSKLIADCASPTGCMVTVGTEGNGTLVVTGSGSELTTDDMTRIALLGEGIVRVENGGRFVTGNFDIAGFGGSGEVIVDGAGSELIAEPMFFDASTGSAELIVSNGGLVRSTGSAFFIGASGSGGGSSYSGGDATAIITGQDSQLEVSSSIYSWIGAGVSGSLVIEDGAIVDFGGAPIFLGGGDGFVVGVEEEIIGQLTVSDPGSEITFTRPLYVGFANPDSPKGIFSLNNGGYALLEDSLFMSSTGILNIELSDNNPNTFIVYGDVDLDYNPTLPDAPASHLEIILNYAPDIDDSFTIVDNFGTGPIYGEFRDLPESSVFEVEYNGKYYQFLITYKGFDGNDVVVTAIDADDHKQKLFGTIIGIDDGVDVDGEADALNIIDAVAQSYAESKDRLLVWADETLGNPQSHYSYIPSLQELLNILGNMQVEPGDTFLFYFSGHGGPDNSNLEAPIDVQRYNPDGSIGQLLLGNRGNEILNDGGLGRDISDDDLSGLFTDPKWDAVKKVFILDACYSGGFKGNSPDDSGDLETLSNYILIAAADEDDVTCASNSDGTGLMTNEILPLIVSGATFNAIKAHIENPNVKDKLGLEEGGFCPIKNFYNPGDIGPFKFKPIAYISDNLSGSAPLLGKGPVYDKDSDDHLDFFDNCIDKYNPMQRDTNNDGYGNLCDPDFNGNGIVDPFDFSLLKSRFGSSDFPDQDLNGNGTVDPFDFSLLKSMFGQPPGPSALAP